MLSGRMRRRRERAKVRAVVVAAAAAAAVVFVFPAFSSSLAFPNPNRLRIARESSSLSSPAHFDINSWYNSQRCKYRSTTRTWQLLEAAASGSNNNNDARSDDIFSSAGDGNDVTEINKSSTTNATTDSRKNPKVLERGRARQIWSANNPLAWWQKAVHKYWDEFQTTTTTTTNESSLTEQQPSLASQFLALLTELSRMDVNSNNFELSYGVPVKSWSKDTEMDKSPSTTNLTSVETWIDSWNKGMTTEDVRDVGDHIWRYLIGG
jgi:hypothetical protein